MANNLLEEMNNLKLKKDTYHINLKREQGNLAGHSSELILDKNCQLKTTGDILAEDVKLVSRVGEEGFCGGIHHIGNVYLTNKLSSSSANVSSSYLKEDSVKPHINCSKSHPPAAIHYHHETQGFGDWIRWVFCKKDLISFDESDVIFKVLNTAPDTILVDYNILGCHSDYSASACLAVEVYTVSL